MITKSDIVNDAFEELRISGLTSAPTPSEVGRALRRMDSMVAGWQNDGLCLSYVISDDLNTGDPADNSGLSGTDALAVTLNLAKALAPSYGKQLHQDTRIEAHNSYNNLFPTSLTYRENDPYQPTGSGHSFGYGYNDRFRFQAREELAPNNCETIDIKVGETGNYELDFTNYLNEISGDTIDSYTVEDGQGVTISSSSESDGIITVIAEGLTEGLTPVVFTLTTSSGRINPETINFNVLSS